MIDTDDEVVTETRPVLDPWMLKVPAVRIRRLENTAWPDVVDIDKVPDKVPEVVSAIAIVYGPLVDSMLVPVLS